VKQFPETVLTPPAAPSSSIRGKIIVALVFAFAIFAFFYFDLNQYVTFENIKGNRDKLLAYTEQHFAAAVGIFMLLYLLQTTFSLPGGAILTVTGGFLFGPFLGTLIVIVPATIGATLAFLAARYLFRDWVERKFGDRIAPLQEGFARNGFTYLLTLRLIPLFPFFLVNLVAGLSRIRLNTYVVATAIGIVPGSFVFANAGRQLGTINSLSEIASSKVLFAFTLLGLVALLPILYQRFRAAR
jgi:uncharacterized membrane protein YdjX (TVP38/TMEM64 family)